VFWLEERGSRSAVGTVVLAAVVGGRLGVDEETGDFGTVDFEGVFEGGDDLVDA